MQFSLKSRSLTTRENTIDPFNNCLRVSIFWELREKKIKTVSTNWTYWKCTYHFHNKKINIVLRWKNIEHLQIIRSIRQILSEFHKRISSFYSQQFNNTLVNNCPITAIKWIYRYCNIKRDKFSGKCERGESRKNLEEH